MQTKKEMWWLFYYIYTENDNESKKTFFRLIDKILKKQKKHIGRKCSSAFNDKLYSI